MKLGLYFERGKDMENEEKIYRQAVVDEILKREGVTLVRKPVVEISPGELGIKSKSEIPKLKYILRLLFVAIHFNFGVLFAAFLILCLPYPYSWIYLPYLLTMIIMQIVFLLSLLEKSSFLKKYW